MIKFRTSTPDADGRLVALLEREGLGETPVSKFNDDPRITLLGRVMRRYSIDELPHLPNALKGGTSFVGPGCRLDGGRPL